MTMNPQAVRLEEIARTNARALHRTEDKPPGYNPPGAGAGHHRRAAPVPDLLLTTARKRTESENIMKLEKFTMTEIVDYYVDYMIENEIVSTRAEAKQLFLNALAYNVVRGAVIEQVVFLQENDDE